MLLVDDYDPRRSVPAAERSAEAVARAGRYIRTGSKRANFDASLRPGSLRVVRCLADH